LPKSLQLKFES